MQEAAVKELLEWGKEEDIGKFEVLIPQRLADRWHSGETLESVSYGEKEKKILNINCGLACSPSPSLPSRGVSQTCPRSAIMGSQ